MKDIIYLFLFPTMRRYNGKGNRRSTRICQRAGVEFCKVELSVGGSRQCDFPAAVFAFKQPIMVSGQSVFQPPR